MTELEKLDLGQEYYFLDEGVDGRKKRAMRLCNRFNSIDCEDYEAQLEVLKEIFGSTGENVYVHRYFNCDDGKNIHVGEDFIANYNVTILDIAPVHIGDYCMIGPGTLIATVNHPLSPKGRMEKMAIGLPVTIGSHVWIGGNCTILPGTKIGNNVVVAAGAVVSGVVPDNSLVAGVPAKVVRALNNDLE